MNDVFMIYRNKSSVTVRFSLLLISVFIQLALQARTYYVSEKGNDKWSGMLARPDKKGSDGPFATLAAAQQAIREWKTGVPLRENVIVIISEGTYHLKAPLVFGNDDGGNEKYSITYKAIGNAIVTGGVKAGFYKADPMKEALTNGHTATADLWVADLKALLPRGFDVEQCYINGERAVRARTPNKGFYAPLSVSETVLEKGNGRVAEKAVQHIDLRKDQSAWLSRITNEEARKVVFTFYHKWDNTRKYIDSVDRKSLSVSISGKGMKSWNPLNDKTQFLIENYKAALDTAGEWYFDKAASKLYYIPLPGQEPSTTELYVPLLEQLVIVRGTAASQVVNLHFENISFKITGYHLPQEGQEPVQAAAPVEAAIMLDFATGVYIKNCAVANTGGSAIWFRENCRNSQLDHSFLYDLGAGGVKIGTAVTVADSTTLTRNITVNNCIVKSGGYIFPCAAGIGIFHAADNNIMHNDVGDFRYSGISVGWVWGYKPSLATHNTIAYNKVHHLGWGELSDMGGIYTLGPSPGTVIRNNIVHHVHSFTYGGWGIYTDEGSSGILIENNLVYKTKSAGFHQHYGKENIIRNNIFALGAESQLQMSKAEPHLSFRITRNIFYYNTGELFKSHPKNYWQNASFYIDSNCYWSVSGIPVTFPDTLPAWKKKGYDQHSVIMNPVFRNTNQSDFYIINKEVLQAIGFTRVDYNIPGVYGDEKWKSKAITPASKEKAFDYLMAQKNQSYAQ